MKNIFFVCIILLYCNVFSQNTNIATINGNWQNCTTWNNPVINYNSINDYKIISNNIIVIQNLPLVHTKKLTLKNGSKLLLNSNNKVSFIGGTNITLPLCTNNNYDNVIVNFAEPIEVKSTAGFLHGLNNPLPTDYEIQVLQPKLFRIGNRDKYEKAYNLAGRVHFVTSDLWNDGHDAVPYDKPVDDFCRYITYLNSIFDWGKIPVVKPGIVWECWNEPNISEQYVGDQKDFFITYKVFYKTLRSKLGINAKISGPNISKFDKVYFYDFFEYCLKNKLEVNVISWHEIWDDPSVSRPFTTLKENVEYIRDNFMNNSRYAPLKMQTIEINEIIAEGDKDNPVVAASHLGYLEKASVDYACKSCWFDRILDEPTGEPTGIGSCANSALNNIFTKDHKKTANWWTYKFYGDGVTNRVKSFNEKAKSIIIASKSVNNPTSQITGTYAQILIGYTDNNLSITNCNYNLTLNNISSIIANSTTTTPIYINLKKIPNLGANKELDAPMQVLVNNINYKNTQDSIYLTLNNINKNDLYQLTISSTPL